VEPATGEPYVEATISGKLVAEDYRVLSEATDEVLQDHEAINLLVRVEDFEGFTAGALWQDLKFDLSHLGQIRRLAIAGETRLQETVSRFSVPFTKAEIRFFGPDEPDAARQWARTGTDPRGEAEQGSTQSG
jgi:hypothetical protein